MDKVIRAIAQNVADAAHEKLKEAEDRPERDAGHEILMLHQSILFIIYAIASEIGDLE